ncbi:hypothetical protein SH1V18_46270 [Vallitalea longa]|uniref:Uncharacterized protein n=1 Tax=Vallitalea longa TaxID=2936439 RepID=A0A9W6DI13_9FIRM|nr:hypothetical protein [Vallitalea longa]GKX32147.1 hypothetical protein SH1V18_46270 [Vallitalea longa]
MKNHKKLIIGISITLSLMVLCFLGIRIDNTDNKKTFFDSTKVYAQTTDDVDEKLNTIMDELEELKKSNPIIAMSSSPYAIVEEITSYDELVNMGIEAVKPMYDILYKRPDAGLYEYILAMAIEEITNQEYIYDVDYGWSNALEFRLCYERKVNNSSDEFEYLMNSNKISNENKKQKITELGVFVVSDLLDELDKETSIFSKEEIETLLQQIIQTVPATHKLHSVETIEEWRVDNEQIYRDLKKLNKTEY